jgi:hypothetical protein
MGEYPSTRNWYLFICAKPSNQGFSTGFLGPVSGNPYRESKKNKFFHRFEAVKQPRQ